MIWNPLFWPRWTQGAALLALAVLLAFAFVRHRENAAVRADRAEAAAKATETARRADTAAQGATEAKRDDIEEGNADARQAAADNPDDPLKAAMDKLREKR